MIKQLPVQELRILSKYIDKNCSNCRNLKKFTTHYKYKGAIVIGECSKLKMVVYSDYKPHCYGVMYEEN